MQLNDKLIMVTGGGQGLGQAMALRLAKQGARLALVDMNQEVLDATCAQVAELGSSAQGYLCNVAEESDVLQTVASIVEQQGTISGLVNNAGITRDGLLIKAKDGQVTEKMSLEQWNAVLDVNLTGVFLCTREVAAHMVEAGEKGCIVSISSISRHGNLGQTNYVASKAGVAAMTVTWAKELARYGIRTGAIAPGFIGTEMVLSMRDDVLEKIAAGIPAKRLGLPDEIAQGVQFILENDYFSGRVLDIDGALRI